LVTFSTNTQAVQKNITGSASSFAEYFDAGGKLDLVKVVLAPPYNSAIQYTPVNLWEHIASLYWDTSGDRKEDSMEGKKYILHGMIEQGRKNDFLAIDPITSKCHAS
jgi:hypothetical protein